MELFARTSLSATRPSTIYASELLNPQPDDDSAWSWSFLRRKFHEDNLEELYSEYQRKLHNGYFSVFILLQIITTALYILILIFSKGDDDILADIVIYLISTVLISLLSLFVFREQLVKRFAWMPLFVSAIIMILLVINDVGLLLWHIYWGSKNLRPAFTTHTIISCYIFFPLTSNKQSLILAMTASVCEFISLGWIVHAHTNGQYYKLASDTVYLITINGLGLYFRFLNEITIRRTFLDRRACVQTTYKLKYEKGQEDQLLLSILPRHFVDEVRQYLREVLTHVQLFQTAPPERSPFSRMYVKEHRDVTIIYADVVNFSKLTVSMKVTKLVETLNELFSKFDQASEDHNVLRIKFLGDCYYGVSGVPEMDHNHAKNCVNLGLDMISIIKHIREERRLKYHLDMRIGIHSGDIFSGLLGADKWQYDIWSKDVVIANHMEQAGEPGKVHVTKQTLDFLGQEFSFKPGYGASRNKLLAKYNIETFFILPKYSFESDSGSLTPDSIRSGSPTFPIYNQKRNSTTRRLTVTKPNFSRRAGGGEGLVSARRNTLFMDYSVLQYQQTLAQADNHMADTIHNMHIGLFDRWLKREQINPCCLTFNIFKWELPYILQPDPLFKFYLLGSLISLLSIIIIHVLVIVNISWYIWLVDGLSLLIVTILLLLSWTWSETLRILTSPGTCFYNLIHFFHKIALIISWKVEIRTLFYFIIICTFNGCIFTLMLDSSLNIKNNIGNDDIPWHISQSLTLAIIMSFFFFKIHYLLKFLTGCLIAAGYAYCIWEERSLLYQVGDSWHPKIEPKLAHLVHVVLLTFSLHLIDRQAEFINRLDFRWKRQLSEEQDQTSETRVINKLLLRNILPNHVAQHYLNMDRSVEDVYCEEYQCVAVMFASLIDSSEESHSDGGIDKVSLIVLNEIICEFDKLLNETNGKSVEKIKVAGWTYMAACGLDTQRDKHEAQLPFTQNHVVVVLLRFATRMMDALAKYNKECNKFQQQSFQLRVGISHGPVNAGVIGAQKPLYDIWGDTVNVASRMDSTGIPGKIQITKHTAGVLKENNFECELRGAIHVKGQGIMSTYFVNLSENFEPKVIIKNSNDISIEKMKLEKESNEINDKFNTKL